MSTTTTNFGFIKPGVNDPIDANQWGTQLNSDLDSLDTLLKKLSVTGIGTTRPTYAAAGTIWVNNSTNPWVLYMYDGTDDIQMGTIDTTTNTFTPGSVVSPTIIFLSTDVAVNTGDTNIPVPQLTFTVKAGKKYNIKIYATIAITASGTGTNRLVSLVSNGPVFAKGSYDTAVYSSVSSDNRTFSANFTNAVLPSSIGLNIAVSTPPILGYINALVQGGASDAPFTLVLNWVASGGSGGSGALKAGSSLMYQETL